MTGARTILALFGALALSGCDCGGIVNFCQDRPEPPPPAPVTMAQLQGTACLFGEWPRPDCLRYRSRIIDRACAREVVHPVMAEDCRNQKRHLPLPPGPRERRPLLPPEPPA